MSARRRALAPLLAGTALLGACTPSLREAPPNPAAVRMETANARQAAVAMLLPGCPVADAPLRAAANQGGLQPAALPALIAGALAPVVADIAFNAAKDYLARLQSERTANWIATGQGVLTPSDTCLVVMRGRIGRPTAGIADQGSLSGAAATQLGLAATPDFYMEARLRVTRRATPAGQPAQMDLLLQPQIVHFARTAARRGQDEAKAIGMVLVMRSAPAAAGADAAATANAAEVVVPLNFGTLVPGREIRPAAFPDLAAESPVGHPLADLARRTSLAEASGRLNFYAFVTETAEPDRVLQLVNDAVSRQSKPLQDALTTAIQDAIKSALGERTGG